MLTTEQVIKSATDLVTLQMFLRTAERCMDKANKEIEPRARACHPRAIAESRLDDFFFYIERTLPKIPDTPGDIKRRLEPA